jgi:hypothetical protein
MHRAVLALAGLTMIVTAESGWCIDVVPLAAPAGVDPACWPLPPYYPRGWERVINTPCPPGFYVPGYYHGAYGHYWPTYGSLAARRRVAYGPAHRRPYLRPGWWW